MLIVKHFLYSYDPEIVVYCFIWDNMEAKVIEGFLPDLVTATSDCVQPVSDQCLAKDSYQTQFTKEYWSQEGPVKTKQGL